MYLYYMYISPFPFQSLTVCKSISTKAFWTQRFVSPQEHRSAGLRISGSTLELKGCRQQQHNLSSGRSDFQARNGSGATGPCQARNGSGATGPFEARSTFEARSGSICELCYLYLKPSNSNYRWNLLRDVVTSGTEAIFVCDVVDGVGDAIGGDP